MSSYLPGVVSAFGADAFDRQIDGLLDEALRTFGRPGSAWAPACNAWEDDDGFYVQIALPGWEPKDISLQVDNQVLTVKGERKDDVAVPQKYHLHEIADGRFTRLFSLPTFIDHDKASATHKNGMLTIAFPKREEARCRRIVIEES